MERPNRPSDSDLIRQAIEHWREDERVQGAPISDTTARMIASQYHGGQDSPFYSFASTGRIDFELCALEVLRCLHEIEISDEDGNSFLEALSDYFVNHGEREAVEGWHEATRWDRDEAEFQVWGQSMFPHLNNEQLIARIERTEAFKTDDEEVELTRRLGRVGLNWMWNESKTHIVTVSQEEFDRLRRELGEI